MVEYKLKYSSSSRAILNPFFLFFSIDYMVPSGYIVYDKNERCMQQQRPELMSRFLYDIVESSRAIDIALLITTTINTCVYCFS